MSVHDPQAICARLGMDLPEIWARTWRQSEGSYEPGGLFFLEATYVRQTCAQLRISPALAEALEHCAKAISADPAAERLAWHLHWLMSCSGLDPQVRQWPAPPLEAHPANALLYGIIVLAGVPRLREINGVRGIPPEDTIETLSDLETWASDYYRWGGVYRLPSLGWISHHLRGRLFKLGRLQYLPGEYRQPFRWFRHRQTRQVVALAEAGLLLREDGQFASADYGRVRTGLWKSWLEETAEYIAGHPVSPRGYVRQEIIRLDCAEWLEVLRPGDPVMTVHIPAKGRLAPEACGASFRRAVEFWRRHFPEIVYRAFTCISWLLDPQFEELNPRPENIAAFMREWYLHPVEGANDQQTWERTFDLFGGSSPAWLEATPQTSLQRALVDFVRAGGHPRSAGGVIFPEDLDWGAAIYRQRRYVD